MNDVRIVVLQRGWVLVGLYSKRITGSSQYGYLDKARVIRVWGTTEGIGELTNGPLSGTRLDLCNGRVEFALSTEILNIKCENSRWLEILT